MPYFWYVTVATDAGKKLAGPYTSRDEAERKCIEMTDARSTLNAFAEGHLPGYYVPRPFKEDAGREITRTRRTDELLREPVTQDTSVTYTPGGTTAYVSTTQPFVKQAGPPVQGTRKRKPRIKLPDNVYRFSRGELLELAEALGMNKAQLLALKPNKHELVALMEAYLSSSDE